MVSAFRPTDAIELKGHYHQSLDVMASTHDSLVWSVLSELLTEAKYDLSKPKTRDHSCRNRHSATAQFITN
jgi:hypothetical protein